MVLKKRAIVQHRIKTCHRKHNSGYSKDLSQCDRSIEYPRQVLKPMNYKLNNSKCSCTFIYYIPINDTTFELSVFWPADTENRPDDSENRINELRFSDSISLSFKTRLMLVTCFCGDVT